MRCGEEPPVDGSFVWMRRKELPKGKTKPGVRTAMAGPTRTVLELLQQASHARDTGAFEKAGKLCRLVLKSYPRQTDALHLLAVLALESQNFAEADRRFRALLSIKPNSYQALLNHSIALCELNQAEEALAQCERALLLGGDEARGHALRASALRALKRGEEALRSYDRAISLTPRNPEIHFNRANLLQDLGRFEEALTGYDAALAMEPTHLGALNNRGNALRLLGRYQEALKTFDIVLSIDARSWQAHNNRGNLFNAMGHLDEAVTAFELAIERDPRNTECHYNLGNAEQDRGRYAEAMQCYTKALSFQANHVKALINRAGTARRLGLYKRAVGDYTAAKRYDPRTPYLDGYIAHTRAQCCDWSRLDDERALLERVRRGERASEPFSLLSLCDSESDHACCAKTWVADKFGVAPSPAFHARTNNDRICVAYLSPDFRNHAVASQLARLIEIHDRQQFRIIGVAFGPKADDEMRRHLSRAFDTFFDISAVSDREARDMLVAERLDIAVDLAGHTEHARTGLLAGRPAPVQVSYLGYPGTMGAPFIDYVLADRWVLPEANRQFYSEKIVYLPDSYQVNGEWAPVLPPTISRRDVGLPEKGFVFCCFNHTRKIRPHVFDVWMRLLKRAPHSVLWLVGDNAETTDNLRREAVKRGVAAERLVFAARVGLSEYVARYTLAGLFLDTLPYNGHATASDALRAGLPVLTCAGSTFAGRVGASLLQAVGLTELITESLLDYEAQAIRLAEDPNHLARVRGTLAANLATYPLFKADRFRGHVEAAYVEMHRRQRAGEAPADFHVPLVS
jgi:protein O-GlcNAc transferase